MKPSLVAVMLTFIAKPKASLLVGVMSGIMTIDPLNGDTRIKRHFQAKQSKKQKRPLGRNNSNGFSFPNLTIPCEWSESETKPIHSQLL